MHSWSTKPEEFKKRVEADSTIQVIIMKKNIDFQLPG
jgi:hypothetical protein